MFYYLIINFKNKKKIFAKDTTKNFLNHAMIAKMNLS